MKFIFLFLCSFAFAQQTKFVDFKSVSAELKLDSKEKSISGKVIYKFEWLELTDTITIDAQNMAFSVVKLNGKNIPFINTGKQIQFIPPFIKGDNTLYLEYKAKPQKALYFLGSEEKNDTQIWTQGQGRYTSNWFPSFDDVNEKLIFNLSIIYDSRYQVISNGQLVQKSIQDDETIWEFKMKNPMSSYLLMLAIGKYQVTHLQAKSGVPIELYIEEEDQRNWESSYQHSATIFNFMEKKIGVKYPWNVYKQVPVRDFLYAGMENTSATIFSRRYIVDKIGFEDRSYTSVDAHELAHQWFGDLITAKSGKDHWLQEGFATYYALLAEKEIKGEDYFYAKLHESAQQIKFASRTDSIPILNEKASSLSFYQKGAWALFVIHESLGDKVFKKVIKNYLKRYAFQNVETQDLFNEIHKLSNFDTTNFSKVWLESTVFNTQEANGLLLKNKSMQLLFEVEKMKTIPIAEKLQFFTKLLESNTSAYLKVAIVNQLKNENYESKKELLRLALATSNIEVRMAVANSLSKIPLDFRTSYESLLHDKSYETQETALYNLWKNFPEQRVSYLDQTKDWIGFNDYNLRTLWLSLALSTKDYNADKKLLIGELVLYSSFKYEAITRQNALEKLIAFQLFNDEVLINLVNATTHHMWQFSKFGRDTIRRLLKNEETRTSFNRILPNLSEIEQFQLKRLLIE
ncbi:M1 family metallopeptidase [Flavobacterium sp. F-380]|uniref:Aminopeptidase N n=1 Tax=Flavobacterium kayseriense TaxID=2764714 RepID=A0ABR7J9U9_9FLAO|nr:M1 family metallopeptidase [Flavobacterium kayseriense]MBC5841972.1 M1 family metallopeptidase [Flavobacterium kayseriense]MBC5848501.1 M1 family metallopeptidase [Flavobacterium kayseriense]